MSLPKVRMKKKMIEMAKNNPLVTHLCQKLSFAKATYYRWIEDDKEFKRAIEKAQTIGRASISDFAENNMFGLAKSNNEHIRFMASKYILEHNSPTYKETNYSYQRIKNEEKIRKLEDECQQLRNRNNRVVVQIINGKNRITENDVQLSNLSQQENIMDMSTNIQDSRSVLDKPSVEHQENQMTSNNLDSNPSNQDNSRDNSI